MPNRWRLYGTINLNSMPGADDRLFPHVRHACLVGGRPPQFRVVRGTLWGSRIRPPVLTWDLGGPLIFADEAAEDGPALDPRLGEVGDRVVGPGRTELTA